MDSKFVSMDSIMALHDGGGGKHTKSIGPYVSVREKSIPRRSVEARPCMAISATSTNEKRAGHFLLYRHKS